MATQYLTYQSGRIAYDDTGSGPLVLCAPSMGDVRAEYRFLTPLLVAAAHTAAPAAIDVPTMIAAPLSR